MRTTLTAGDSFAGYRIESFVARGGMAVVYRAHDPRLQRDVALKLLGPDVAQSESFRKRFIQESLMAASLDHPNIVPVYDADTFEESLYIAMRYVPGPNLQELLASVGALDPAHVLALLGQVAGALDAAHEMGLVHRDVKPGNVLIAHRPSAEPGHVYLTDFGLTKRTSSLSGLTEAGHFLGTLDYIAPEQILGEPVSARSDVYALGCVLFEMLTGRIPFERPIDAAKIYAHLEDDPPSVQSLVPELPAAADRVVRCALAKRPEERYPTCCDMVADLRDALADGGVALPYANGSRRVGAAGPVGGDAAAAPEATGAAATASDELAADSAGAATAGPLGWSSAPTTPVDLTGAPAAVTLGPARVEPQAARTPAARPPVAEPPAGRIATPRAASDQPTSAGAVRIAQPRPPEGDASAPPGTGRRGLPDVPRRARLALAALVLAVAAVATAAFVLRGAPPAAAEAVLPFAAETYPDQGLEVSRTWVLRGSGDRLHGELLVTARTKRLASFVEVLPKSLAASASKVDFKPSPGRIVRADPVVEYTTAAAAVYTYDIPVPAGPVDLQRLRGWAKAQQTETATYFRSTRQRAPLTVTRITLSPAALQLRAGGLPHRLAVAGTYSNGKPAPAAAVSGALLQADNPSVAALDAQHNLRPVGVGTATVTASLGALSVRSSVQVGPAPGTSVAPGPRTATARTTGPAPSSPVPTRAAPSRSPAPRLVAPPAPSNSSRPTTGPTSSPTSRPTSPTPTPSETTDSPTPSEFITTTAPGPDVVTTTPSEPQDPPPTTDAADPQITTAAAEPDVSPAATTTAAASP